MSVYSNTISYDFMSPVGTKYKNCRYNYNIFYTPKSVKMSLFFQASGHGEYSPGLSIYIFSGKSNLHLIIIPL